MNSDRLGRFEIEGLLGEGGMGAVYAACDPESGERVALKVLFSTLVEDEQKFLRFTQEVAALSRLEHPGIVRLLGPLQREGDRVFFPMELVEGETLSAFLRREGAMTVHAALKVVRPVVEALGAAHETGIVHRDVKPANILLTEGGLKVTDFGLARMDDVTRLTQTGQIMGTLDYMSPEQVEGVPVDGRSDLYSVGILLYELLTGKPPFRRPTPGAVLKGHLTDSPTRLERIRSDLPPGLSDLVDRLLAKDPDDRFADARETLAALKMLKNTADTIAFRPDCPPTPEEDEPTLAVPLPEKRAWLLPLVVSVLVLLGTGAYFALRKRNTEPVPQTLPAVAEGTTESAPPLRPGRAPSRPPGLRRDRRALLGRVREFFGAIDTRGPEMLARMESAGLMTRSEREACLKRLKAATSRGRLDFRVVEEESTFGKTKTEVMVRCPALAEVLARDDDGFFVIFLKSGRDRIWRPVGIRRAGS